MRVLVSRMDSDGREVRLEVILQRMPGWDRKRFSCCSRYPLEVRPASAVCMTLNGALALFLPAFRARTAARTFSLYDSEPLFISICPGVRSRRNDGGYGLLRDLVGFEFGWTICGAGPELGLNRSGREQEGRHPGRRAIRIVPRALDRDRSRGFRL